MFARASILLACCLGFGCSDAKPDPSDALLRMTKAWTTPLVGGTEEGRWTGTPVVSGGLVLFGVRGGIAAFDTATGRPVWRTRLWTNGNHAYGYIRVIGNEACMEDWPAVGCVDIATGRVLWSAIIPASTANCETALDSSAFYVGTDSHKVYALDRATGNQLWVTDINPGIAFSSRVYGLAFRG